MCHLLIAKLINVERSDYHKMLIIEFSFFKNYFSTLAHTSGDYVFYNRSLFALFFSCKKNLKKLFLVIIFFNELNFYNKNTKCVRNDKGQKVRVWDVFPARQISKVLVIIVQL